MSKPMMDKLCEMEGRSICKINGLYFVSECECCYGTMTVKLSRSKVRPFSDINAHSTTHMVWQRVAQCAPIPRAAR